MSEIEEGEYIRTRKGITKIEEVNKGCALCENSLIVDIKTHKHSKNIIDLIEVGDFVNGNKVIDVGDVVITQTSNIEDENFALFEEKDIKTILTHEQYEEICFRKGI